MPVYYEVFSLTNAQFDNANNAADNNKLAIDAIREVIPHAQIYQTVFHAKDELWQTDTDGRRLQKVYTILGKKIDELPSMRIEVPVVEYKEVPTGISEDLLIRAISAAAHKQSNAVR